MFRRKSSTVTSRQLEVLRLLSRSKSYSVGEIASTLGISYNAATKMINRLVAKGLVQRSTNEKDRRITNVNLTPAGAQALRLFGSLPDREGGK